MSLLRRVAALSPALLCMLVSLMVLDTVTTLIGVVGMGAAELNPISSILGFPMFIVLKVLVTVTAVYTINQYMIPSIPLPACVCMLAMIVLYGAVCAANIYRMIGEVL